MLQWATYKYSVEDYNAQVEEINKRSVLAYHLLLSYDPKTRANTFFPGVRHVVCVHNFKFLSIIISFCPRLYVFVHNFKFVSTILGFCSH